MFGNYKSDKLKKRLRALENTARLISDIEESTRLNRKSLKDILLCSDNSLYQLGYLNDFCLYISDMPQPDAIKKAVLKSDDCLTEEDRAMLCDFYVSLGRNDIKKELEIIHAFAERLDRIIKSAREEYENKGMLYRKISLLIGLLVAVFLI